MSRPYTLTWAPQNAPAKYRVHAAGWGEDYYGPLTDSQTATEEAVNIKTLDPDVHVTVDTVIETATVEVR